MAKEFKKIDSQNEDFFRKAISNTTNLEMNVNFKFRSDNDAKLMLEAKKVSALNKSISEGTDVVIIINEDIFDRLTDDLQDLACKELVHGIEFNGESNTVNVKEKDLTTYADFLESYDISEIVTLTESIKSVKDQIEKDVKALKQLAKENKQRGGKRK